MNKQFSRRALVAGAAAVGGGYLASQVRDVSTLTSRLGNVRLQSFSREPIFLAMLDRHVQRLQPFVPEIERTLNRRLQIDGLSTDQLYANFTIDLLQQTGRYDLVSINDHWIPYFGRRGYLSEVESIDNGSSGVVYPPLVEAAAIGIDDTRFVAYPWTVDFTCSAVRSDMTGSIPMDRWSATIDTIEHQAEVAVGLGLQMTSSAAEVYRSILLSFGEELLGEDDGEPILDHHWHDRTLDLIVRLARQSTASSPVETSLVRVIDLAESSQVDLLPVCWATDCRPLIDSGLWTVQPLPAGRTGRRRAFVGVWMWGVPAGAPSADKAREFVELMTSPDMQARLWPSASLIPATRSAIQSSDTAWLRMRPLAFDALDHGQLRPALRSYRSIMEIVGQMVAEAVTRQTPRSQLLESANTKIREVLVLEGELGGLT